MRRELLEAMSAGAENCRRADSISYIYIQQVFEYEGNCGETGRAHRIRELARAFSNEIGEIRAAHVPNFEIKAGCGAKRGARSEFAEANRCALCNCHFQKRGRGHHHTRNCKIARSSTHAIDPA